ncbi:unnamed protein product [Peronospora belbahrii]|uniref:ERCC4 domain-containing protein n=1 Tax=Peronospora belbahrii TaxID=622444 RepID=A0ABN8D861_9STRA|nr:unnamed protein product [Peronospora belbahrii]
MSTTPSKYARSRSRDSIEDDEDDHILDEMLIELGIPANKRMTKDVSVEVIELITPPRNSPPAKKRKQSDGLSYVDLTTSPLSPCPSSIDGNIPTILQTAEEEEATVDEEQQQDEISFSYSPSECPPSFVYSPENSSSSSSLEVLSPHSSLTARRQVFTDEKTQKETRRLSGKLEDLHFETIGSNEPMSETIRTDTMDTATATTNAATDTVVTDIAAASLAAEDFDDRARILKKRSLPRRSRAVRGKSGGSTAAVVAVVQMEKSLDTSVAGESIRDALKNHVYKGKPVPYTVATALDCIVPGVIRWERRGSGTSSYSCAIYYEAGECLKLLQKQSYMELVHAVQYLQTLVPKTQGHQTEVKEESSKFFIIVEGMDRALIELKRQQKQKKGSASGDTSSTTFAMITFADLHEVAFQLFMDVRAHTKFTSDLNATADYIALLTRELVVASSRVSALEEFLEAVPRHNSFRVTHTGSIESSCANTWLRMLQVIPGVSEDKAQCLLDHFPTFDSLMQAYRDPNLSRAQKQDLVADKLNDVRIQRALSKRIYTVFCEENPDALI